MNRRLSILLTVVHIRDAFGFIRKRLQRNRYLGKAKKKETLKVSRLCSSRLGKLIIKFSYLFLTRDCLK